MSITVVDRIGNRVIRKLHSPDRTKVFGYLLVELEGDNILDRQEFKTLGEARHAAGFMQTQSKLTAPKSSYQQNQKGYHAAGANSPNNKGRKQ